MSDADVNHFSVLMEQIVDQNRAVLEYVSVLPKVLTRLDAIEQDVAELKQDIKVVKAAVTDLGRQVNEHEHQLARLKAA
jgi:septal ring factor EnvC (AmiA/AmiB activator)